MTIGGVVPGWQIGYLAREDATGCEYRMLDVISLITTEGGIEPVVMSPDGQALRASAVGLELAFAVGPDEDANKAAQAHAARRGRVVRSAAA